LRNQICLFLTRAHNSREVQRNAKLIIGMNGNTTTIQDPGQPNEEPRKVKLSVDNYGKHPS